MGLYVADPFHSKLVYVISFANVRCFIVHAVLIFVFNSGYFKYVVDLAKLNLLQHCGHCNGPDDKCLLWLYP